MEIAKYILKKCLINTLMILGACVLLFAIFSILGQIGDIGKGNFTTLYMLVYILMLVPNYIYLLMPIAILIGVMVSMLGLVNYSEYAIIRTSGVSLHRIMGILLFFGVIFSLITFTLGEFVAPLANHYAQVYKKIKTHELLEAQLHSGIWSKDQNNSFVNIKQIMPDNTILGVSIFNYDCDLNLQTYITALDGKFDDQNKVWILHKLHKVDYTHQNIIKTTFDNYTWKTSIEPSYFNVLIIAPEDMSALALIEYMHHLELNKQSVQRYEIAFWGKLLYPIACISMSLIALAFTPNNRRNINLASKLFIGILIGVAFFFTTKLIGFMALLFHWNAILSALTPTVLLFVVGWFFVMRKE